MTREQTIEQLEALVEGVHPGTGVIVEEASPLRDPTVRQILFAATVLLKDGRPRGAREPRVSLEERNRAEGRPLRSSARWDEEEERRLTDGVAAGAGLRELAKELQRSPGALTSRLVRLGLVLPTERFLGYEDLAERARERCREGREKSATPPG